jgi:outer membrane receptor protein involved in Fe transport
MSTDGHRSKMALSAALFLRRGLGALTLSVLICVHLWFHLSSVAQAQIQIGMVRGTVTDPAGAVVAGAAVRLDHPLAGYRQATITDEQGAFVFHNVPFEAYTLRVEAAQFQAAARNVSVRSNLPVTVEIRLSLAEARETVTIAARQSLIEADSTSTEVDLDESFIRRAPGATRSRQLPQLIATTPGWTTQNNGLLHIRGVDDGILYVVDGIPTIDRLDAVSASNFDTDMIRSANVITGNLPAEFGGRSGAVIVIQPKSGIALPLMGSLEAAVGQFRGREAVATLGGKLDKRFGFFLASSASRSDRFLDPVDLGNFNNRGGTFKFNARGDWHPTAKDIVLFNLSANGTDFRVPNRREQELARQRQRQELRDNSQSFSWQRIWSPVTVSNFALFHRAYEATLFGSAFDTPISAAQDRRHTRLGALASVTHLYRGHTFKAGLEAMRVAPREFFTFAITDEEEAEEQEISEAALVFTPANPFVFRDRKVRGQVSWYVQDQFSPRAHLTVTAGLRYDHSSLPVSDQQFSPRLGVVYYLAATKTALRASFNRLYMPPQVENLLLADSAQARQLSPFAAEPGGGGASIRPEKTSAYEAGLTQDVGGWFKLDTAFWWRTFRNFDDPNVFFNTTIIFPNSVAKGFARGVDVRLDLPSRRGWSGYLSYANQRILQTGPINGGLFLTDEVIEIGPGTRFIPDHDERNVGAFGVTYYHQRTGLWAAFSGRHESGVPLEVEEERLEDLRAMPGAELVDFARERVRPWTVFHLSLGVELFRDERVAVSAQMDWQNLANRRFAYNFGSPFEGTHFGYPRLWSGRVKFEFR